MARSMQESIGHQLGARSGKARQRTPSPDPTRCPGMWPASGRIARRMLTACRDAAMADTISGTRSVPDTYLGDRQRPGATESR